MCFGDFNVAVEESEKEGGHSGSSSAPNFLKELLFDLGVVNLGYSGTQFTWWNKRWGKGAIRERLDRAISNIDWRMTFPKAAVIHLGAINSDHNPLLVDTNPTEEFVPRPFRFEAMWTRDPRCGGVIKKAWEAECRGNHSFILCHKQRKTTIALKRWNRDVFGNSHTMIKKLTNQIEENQKLDRTKANSRQEANLQGELNEWLRRNEVLWKQKSREQWLKDGDKNSKSFHLSTIIRRKRNSIDAIKDEEGNWITCKKEIRDHVVTKFTQLFSEESVAFPLDLENLITPGISMAENSSICKIPSSQEIEATIFDMNIQKAPGPDGLSVLFYKRYWNIMGPTVIAAIQNFFNSG
jgi:hypothetical protein